MLKHKKGDLNISFGLIFAIVVGAFIIFLAIIIVSRLSGIEKTSSDTKTAKQIGVLLEPLETGFETGQISYIKTPSNTRIYNGCSERGIFGRQTIKISQESYGKWSDSGGDISFENKYIFSEEMIEGETFYIFSKPFEFPFKIADLVIITSSSSNYCFVDAPAEIKKEIENLQSGISSKNIHTENCPSGSMNVCFNSNKKCDVNVNTNLGTVEKGDQNMYYEGYALMYSAIFSDNSTYECQIQRLMKRVSELADVYNGKEQYLISKGCSGGLIPGLTALETYSKNFDGSGDIFGISIIAKNLEKDNEDEGRCRIW